MPRTVPDNLTKLVISGTLASGAEKFAFSLWYRGYTLGGQMDPTALDGLTEFATFRDAVLGFMSTGDAITAYDQYFYQGGVAVGHTTAVVNHAGLGSSNIMPAQIALVLTLRTTLATRRGRGRIYVPVGSAGLATLTRLPASPANYNTLSDKLAALFGAQSLGGIIAVVVSQTGNFATDVSAVSVDTVLDTQRRRRNKLSSPVHTSPVP